MTIDEAIKELQRIKTSKGNIPLMAYVQTGTDSYEWRDVTFIIPAVNHKGFIVEIST